MDAENTGVEFQNQMNFGFDSTDNEVSTMVDQYLTKDPLQLDEDWAAAVDSALFMIANPDHHMSMPSSTTSANLDATHFHGMHYSDANQPHYPNEQLQYEAYQSAPQQYLHTDRGNVQIQYIDPQQQQTYQIVEQVGQNSMALYGNQQGYSQGNSGDYNQTSPVYYVAQTVQNIPLAEPAHPAHLTFTYENYASLPHGASLPRLNTMASHGLQQAAQRTRSASSAGNSPSSQSPVSEEEFVESTTKTFAPRRQSKDSVPPKKAKQVKPRRLRKRDPNEPTKPVSAYALFFRDKQATIKGSKPDASFGEVSKIVAHMWDNLEPEKKSNYKKRTEEAKKDYLAQLAHYRASLVSSPNDAPLYIQTSFMSRSPPIHMQNSYNRHPYSHQTQSHLKMHLSASPAMNHSANLVQDPDCLQSSTHMNENGQIYARVMEPDMHHKNNYVNPVHAQFWESQGKADDDGIVAHCKDEFPHEWLTQQLQPSSTAKVVI